MASGEWRAVSGEEGKNDEKEGDPETLRRFTFPSRGRNENRGPWCGWIVWQ